MLFYSFAIFLLQLFLKTKNINSDIYESLCTTRFRKLYTQAGGCIDIQVYIKHKLVQYVKK